LKNYRKDAAEKGNCLAENVVIRIGEGGHASHQGVHSSAQLTNPVAQALSGTQTHHEVRREIDSVERMQRPEPADRKSSVGVDLIKQRQVQEAQSIRTESIIS